MHNSVTYSYASINVAFAVTIFSVCFFYSFAAARSLPSVNSTKCSCTYLNGELNGVAAC